ncbi:hypothetical protein HS088_TW07G00555 [Tripterygium wilfordii]|uniref:Uncharacterized protein n=1 Tax=Tripterygium wilfordii TaxID=458696 RepID=A0A7J7DFA7_TRIWF|nr:hypothetical protein HS088_TW07G00555 [Tripterygium wilfordii]
MSLIPHSSASSSSSRTYEICLVCEANYGTRDYRYEVFVVDVGPCSGGDHGLRVLRNPLFRIPDAYATMGFFAVDSSIYFLGGFRLGEPDPSLRISNNVYVYDTSSSDSAIKKLSCMNYGKLLPVIIGPLNEKFYAISKYLSFHDFEEKVECRAYPMSLGDGLVCAVVAGYDPGYDQIVPAPAPAPAYDDDPHLPSTHIISIGVFVDGPKFNPLYTHQYKDDHNMKYCKRTLVASFPL